MIKRQWVKYLRFIDLKGNKQVKYLVSALFIVFVTTTVFGFVSMSDMMNHLEKGGCVSSAVSGVTCISTTIDAVLHHIRAYNMFSSVIVASTFSLMILAIGLMAFGFLALLYFKRFNFGLRQVFTKWSLFSNYFFNKRQQELSWLSLFEHSPSF